MDRGTAAGGFCPSLPQTVPAGPKCLVLGRLRYHHCSLLLYSACQDVLTARSLREQTGIDVIFLSTSTLSNISQVRLSF